MPVKGIKKIKERIVVYSPNHPYNYKGYVLLSRLNMEKKIGRYLFPTEVVHHLDCNKQNDEPDNLYLFKTTAEHSRHHQTLKRLILIELGLYKTRKEYLLEHRERKNMISAIYHQNNKKRLNYLTKLRHLKNKEKFKQYQRTYYLRNKAKKEALKNC